MIRSRESSDRRAPGASSLEIYLLGLVDFDSALVLQQRLVSDLADRADTQGALLLCEHPPLITMGREASTEDVRADADTLRACEIGTRWVCRGGGAVLHAPGQLAAYPVLPLARLHLSPAAYRQRLEQSLVEVCHDLHVPAKRLPDQPGVWSRAGQVASVGISIKSDVSLHGAFLNVDPDPMLMSFVAPAHADSRMTSLRAQRLERVLMPTVRERVIQRLTAALGYERYHIYTGHPWLKRTTRRICVHA